MYEQKSLASKRILLRSFQEIYQHAADNLPGQITDINFDESKDQILIHTEWEDYCRGCHMGTIDENFAIPVADFFDNLGGWVAEDKRQKKEAAERKEQAEKVANARWSQEEERRTYERLRTKFEGE